MASGRTRLPHSAPVMSPTRRTEHYACGVLPAGARGPGIRFRQAAGRFFHALPDHPGNMRPQFLSINRDNGNFPFYALPDCVHPQPPADLDDCLAMTSPHRPGGPPPFS